MKTSPQRWRHNAVTLFFFPDIVSSEPFLLWSQALKDVSFVFRLLLLGLMGGGCCRPAPVVGYYYNEEVLR